MDKHIKYYTTGEFAQLCGVNKKTLFHYDNINLLKPEKITENGYRYYSSNQLELFSVINILKDLEMPLKEIKEFLDTRTPEKTVALFNKEKSIIEDKISHLKRVQKLLDVKLEIIEEAQTCSHEIFIEHNDEEIIILSDIVKNTGESYDVNTFAEHIKYCKKNNLSYGYTIGSIIKKERLINEDFNIMNNFILYDYYFSKVPNLKMFNKYPKKPEGDYAVIYHFGYYDTVYKSYKKLFEFLNNENLQIDGDAYEEVLIDDVVTRNVDDYVIKISIKIKNE